MGENLVKIVKVFELINLIQFIFIIIEAIHIKRSRKYNKVLSMIVHVSLSKKYPKNSLLITCTCRHRSLQLKCE